MLTESYRFGISKNKTQFFFESEGKQGKIMKVVNFTLISDDLWNVGFGDWHKGKIDDLIISNNHDIVKVITTIANIMFQFFKEFPERSVRIKPIDEKRKRLYNRIFQRHYKEIETDFIILGLIDNLPELYLPKSFYDSFILKLKNENR